MDTPLLHGSKTHTPLDLITENLYFIFPLNPDQVDFLNTIIYSDKYFHINYWSLTHLIFGIFWGIMHIFLPNIFSILNYFLFHTIFEFWELYAGGYLTGEHPIIIPEIIDIIMDTLFGLIGILIIKFFKTYHFNL